MTQPDADADAEVKDLLERAARIKLVALGFVDPADGLADMMGAVFRRVAASGPLQDSGVAQVFDQTRAAWSLAQETQLRLEYTRLFLGQATCSPHETSYGDARRIAGHGVELADINGFYRAFGFELASENPDLPDHLSTELEFYSLLLVKQAYAAHEGATEPEAVTAQAARSFLEQHLGRWVPAFLAGLEEHQAQAPYLTLGRLLAALIANECARQDVSPQLHEGRLPPDFVQTDEFVCPRAE